MANLIDTYVGQYVKNVNRKQLNISVFKGRRPLPLPRPIVCVEWVRFRDGLTAVLLQKAAQP